MIISSFRQQKGLSLIEVLISVFILAVGLLGLAAMQLQSLKYTQGSQWRSQANFLAYDIVERIRANRASVADYVIAMNAAKPSGSLDTMAKNDLYLWLDQLETTIPSGDGSVAWDSGTRTLTIVVTSQDQGRVRQVADATAADTIFTYTTQLDQLP